MNRRESIEYVIGFKHSMLFQVPLFESENVNWLRATQPEAAQGRTASPLSPFNLPRSATYMQAFYGSVGHSLQTLGMRGCAP